MCAIVSLHCHWILKSFCQSSHSKNMHFPVVLQGLVLCNHGDMIPHGRDHFKGCVLMLILPRKGHPGDLEYGDLYAKFSLLSVPCVRCILGNVTFLGICMCMYMYMCMY